MARFLCAWGWVACGYAGVGGVQRGLTGAAGFGECLMDGDMRAFWFQHSAFTSQNLLVTSSNATDAETEADQGRPGCPATLPKDKGGGWISVAGADPAENRGRGCTRRGAHTWARSTQRLVGKTFAMELDKKWG